MALNRISLIGLDAYTDLKKVNTLSNFVFNGKFLQLIPFITEWGILYSKSRAGKELRYPSLGDIDRIVAVCQNDCDLSIHLCGHEAIDEFLHERSPFQNHFRYPEFSRIQLNINLNDFQDNAWLVDSIIKQLRHHTIVIQENKTKHDFVTKLKFQAKRHNLTDYLTILHDASGGRGKVISNVERPDVDFYTGYAGGLNPDNVVSIVDQLDSLNIMDTSYYIDMESGIRTTDLLDVNKCTSIVKQLMKMP